MSNPTGTPHFSIIIPVYNRAQLIGRALESCLTQDFRDFEVVVVDDGSTDGSSDAVKRYSDPRIRLIRHTHNRGVCPARNTAADVAKGAWVIAVDSDDELLPGALTLMHSRTVEADASISGLRFMCRLDNGELSPYPPLTNQVWDYEGFIRWWDSCHGGRQDTLPCVRRVTFKLVRYPEDRSLEGAYHLDFARPFRTRGCSDVVQLVHNDAPDRLTQPSVESVLRSAPDQVKGLESLLSSHGDKLESVAPRLFFQQLSGLVTLKFLAGDRLGAVRWGRRCLCMDPYSLKVWGVLILGLIGSKPLAWFRLNRSRYLGSQG
jgi:glycosyltransferase involved in cell wall biosynthesis